MDELEYASAEAAELADVAVGTTLTSITGDCIDEELVFTIFCWAVFDETVLLAEELVDEEVTTGDFALEADTAMADGSWPLPSTVIPSIEHSLFSLS